MTRRQETRSQKDRGQRAEVRGAEGQRGRGAEHRGRERVWFKKLLTFALISDRIFVLKKKGGRNVAGKVGVSANAATEVVAADCCEAAEAAVETVGLVAEAGVSVICYICRARTTGKRRKYRRAPGESPLALFYFWGCTHSRAYWLKKVRRLACRCV